MVKVYYLTAEPLNLGYSQGSVINTGAVGPDSE